MGIDAIIQDVIINLQTDMKSTRDTFTPSSNLPHTEVWHLPCFPVNLPTHNQDPWK